VGGLLGPAIFGATWLAFAYPLQSGSEIHLMDKSVHSVSLTPAK
jgi:hypothetical protein